MSFSPNQWHKYDFFLKFAFGEIKLFNIKIPILRKVFNAREILEETYMHSLPTLDRDLDGYYLASAPSLNNSDKLYRDSEFNIYFLKSYRHCFIDLKNDFDTYQKKFKSKTRTTIKRKVKRFKELSSFLDFRYYELPDDMEEFYKNARIVSELTYQENLLDCGFPKGKEFLEGLKVNASLNKVRGYLLFHDGIPISYMYCPIDDGVVKYAYLGYDKNYAKYSPGTVLQWLALEQIFSEQSFDIFDFTEGDNDHKILFCTHNIECSNILILRRKIKYKILLLFYTMLNNFVTFLGDILDKFNIKGKVKKRIRVKAGKL